MDKLNYIIGKFFKLTGIPVSVTDAEGGVFFYEKGYQREQNPLRFCGLGEAIAAGANTAGIEALPFVKFDDDTCAYGAMKDGGRVVIFGPVELRSLKKLDVQRYATSRGISAEGFYISPRSYNELVTLLSMLYYIMRDVRAPEAQIKNIDERPAVPLEEKDVSGYYMQNTENEIKRLGYNAEIAYLTKIKEGDVEALGGGSKGLDFFAGNVNLVGHFADKSLKHFEYMVCSSITLATRAAIDGGLSPETAYAVSDLYMQRLEHCGGVQDVLSLHLEMKVNFARKVRESKDIRSQNSCVEKIKQFVAKRLNKPFDLDELAAAMFMSKHYISRKFKEETGMSIMRYAQSERIAAAANMLKYSDESINAVAAYLCFATQSHFGVTFKEFMGVTPQQYRNANRVIEVDAGG